RGCLSIAGGWCRHPNHPADARSCQHSANAAVSEPHRRGTPPRTGGELEQQRPTTSTRIRSLKLTGRCQGVSVRASVTNRSQRGPERLEKWLRGPATVISNTLPHHPHCPLRGGRVRRALLAGSEDFGSADHEPESVRTLPDAIVCG